MDMATVAGLVLAWGALLGSLVMEGGDVKALINVPAFLLVFGGTLGASMASARMETIRALPDILRQAFAAQKQDLNSTIRLLVRLADKARREGLLGLEAEAKRLGDPFLERGVRLVADGSDPNLIRAVMTNEIVFLQARHRVGEGLFATMGGFAPTLGIIGTVMGLIHMLANLSDPGKMGPLIAGAFIATLYGVSSANLLFIPLSNKLRMRSTEEVLLREMVVEGVLAIQAGENPRFVEERLKTFLAPRLRVGAAGANMATPTLRKTA